jgi:hypothetical protein
MKEILKKQKGFGSVGIVLVIFILVVVGVSGWLVYKHEHKSVPLATNNSSTTTGANALNATNATKLVAQFYDKYKACKADATCKTNAVQQYGTSNLSAYYKPASGSYAEDPIVCAQSLPNSFGAMKNVTTTPIVVIGTFTESFGAQSKTISFSVIKQSSSSPLKINTIICTPELTPH